MSQWQNTGKHVINIENGIWFVYNLPQVHYCQIYSSLNGLIDTLSMTETTLVRILCENTIVCMHIQLSAASYIKRPVTITRAVSKLRKLSGCIVPIKSMTQIILSSYQYKSEETITYMIIDFTRVQPKLESLINDFVLWVIAGTGPMILMTSYSLYYQTY
jgi:hypothetical protein